MSRIRRILVVVGVAAALALIGAGAAITQTRFKETGGELRLECGTAWHAAHADQTSESWPAIKAEFVGTFTQPPNAIESRMYSPQPAIAACISSGKDRVTLGLSLAGLGAAAVIATAAIGLAHRRRSRPAVGLRREKRPQAGND